mmetsp:Transcript_14366/g.46963  ORF Transcript_14366/g.46963 Transcript_14366/m.46963 type:complete len:316 (+) Transcript_14366:1341-2288(+)
MMVPAADTAACLTPPDPSATQDRSRGSTETTCGSNMRPRVSDSASHANRAASRPLEASAVLDFSSAAACSAAMTPSFFSVAMPKPLTSPASPNAAPRLMAYDGVESSVPSTSCRAAAPLGFISGPESSEASDRATVRCTISDGVASASTSFVRTRLTRGSSGEMCLANAARQTTAPTRARSSVSEEEVSDRNDSSIGESSGTIRSGWGCWSMRHTPAETIAEETASTGSPNDLLRKAKMTGSCITATAGASAARPVATPCRAGQPTSSASPAVSPPPGMPPFPAAAAAAAAPPFLPAVVAWLLGGGGADGGADVL